MSRALFLLFFFYVGRKLAATEFGTLNLALSTTFIMGVLFLDPGLTITTVQRVVDEPEKVSANVGGVFTLKCLLFAPMLLALSGTELAFGARLPRTSIFIAAALYTFCYAIFDYFCFITNAYHRMETDAFLRICNRSLTVLLGFIAVYHESALAVLWAMVLAAVLSCAHAWAVLRWRLGVLVTFRWSRTVIIQSVRAGLPVAGTLVLTAIYLKWDLLVLTYFKIGLEKVGWYACAFKIVEAFSAIPTLVGIALFPIIVKLRNQAPSSLDRLLRISTKIVLMAAIPTATVFSYFSVPIISAVYGPKYVGGAPVLSVLIWCIVPMFLYFYLVYVNIAVGQARYNVVAGAIALCAGLVANVALIPHIGYMGAAWSALIANLTFALVATSRVCLSFNNARIPRTLGPILLAAGAMGCVFLARPGRSVVYMGLMLLVYFAGLVVFGVLGMDDLVLASRALQFRSQLQHGNTKQALV